MGNANVAAERITARLTEQDRSVRWLHRQTGIPYKTLLNQLKGRRPITLETTCDAASALKVPIQELVE